MILLRTVGSSSALNIFRIIIPKNQHQSFSACSKLQILFYNYILRIKNNLNQFLTVLGNTRHVQVLSQNFVPRTMADRYWCCEVVYRLGAVSMYQHCNLFDLAFSSNRFWPTSTHIILQTVSPMRKTSVPPNTTLRLNAYYRKLAASFETFQ